MDVPAPNFGRYLLLRRVSVGGTAELFKAKAFGPAGFEKVVAVKRLLPHAEEDPELDYDRYAAAEAALAWLNHAVTLTAPRSGFHPARWATTALTTLSSACASAGALVGHAKLSLDTPGGLVKASLTEAGRTPRLDVTGPGRASGGRAAFNLRIAWTPESLDRAAADAVRAADLACGTHTAPEPGTPAFRPAYPRPTHRITAGH